MILLSGKVGYRRLYEPRQVTPGGVLFFSLFHARRSAPFYSQSAERPCPCAVIAPSLLGAWVRPNSRCIRCGRQSTRTPPGHSSVPRPPHSFDIRPSSDRCLALRLQALRVWRACADPTEPFIPQGADTWGMVVPDSSGFSPSETALHSSGNARNAPGELVLIVYTFAAALGTHVRSSPCPQAR